MSSSPAAPRTSARPKAKPKPTPSRQAVLSRSSTRGTKMYAEVDLNLWTAPGAAGQDVGLLHEGDPALVTGLAVSGRQQVLVDGAIRWVTAGNLSTDKPAPSPAAAPSTASGANGALSDAPCPDGSVESGLKPETIRLYRAVCHAFPEVKTYYGWGSRSEHDTGNALDVMVYGDKALGDRIADWAKAHASALDLYDVIWYDRIWTPVRASEGWRDYGDHGSATANHMDHVHIGTN
ncbi:MAG TPA: hypothetical protein VFR99_08025 [Marmoricola sp.]|nr:hypothetical protein [Marmoricola sp.]